MLYDHSSLCWSCIHSPQLTIIPPSFYKNFRLKCTVLPSSANFLVSSSHGVLHNGRWCISFNSAFCIFPKIFRQSCLDKQCRQKYERLMANHAGPDQTAHKGAV